VGINTRQITFGGNVMTIAREALYPSKKKSVVLSLFDLTGIFVQPWIEAGCEGWIVDIQHRQGMQKEM
jgi:hypothetical protein